MHVTVHLVERSRECADPVDGEIAMGLQKAVNIKGRGTIKNESNDPIGLLHVVPVSNTELLNKLL